jgi:hypothetical protein
MSPEAQRIAIAEACGWKICLSALQSGLDVYKGPLIDDATECRPLPDYIFDLNAMHEAEKVLDTTNGGPKSGDCLRYAYSRELYKLVPEWMQPFRATAAQRAEAFLRTLGKWDDNA